MTVTQTYAELGEELAYRAKDGMEVGLFWRKADGRLTVQVSDAKTGDFFELDAPSDRALEVFYHPYAYLARAEYRADDGAAKTSPDAETAHLRGL